MKVPRLTHDWYPVPLPDNVVLGPGSWLYSAFAFLHCRSRCERAVTIGASSGVYNGSFFELGHDGEVVIGHHSTLVGAIIATNGCVRIGNYCFIAHEVVIGSSPYALPHRGPLPTCNPPSAPLIELADDVWIGAGAILLDGAKIGAGAVIGAAAVVDFEVPALAIVAGNPARIVGFAGGHRPDGVASQGP